MFFYDAGHRTDLYHLYQLRQINQTHHHTVWNTQYAPVKSTLGITSVCHLSTCRVEKSRGVVKKMLLGVAVGTPLMVGVKYAVSEPRERRKMRILAEGVGRFCRSV